MFEFLTVVWLTAFITTAFESGDRIHYQDGDETETLSCVEPTEEDKGYCVELESSVGKGA